MNVICGIGNLKTHRPGTAVVTVGVFDGVHRGHQSIFRRMKAEALRRRMRAVVVTFKNHPAHFFQPGRTIPMISSLRQRLDIFKSLGVDEAVVVEFDRGLANMEPERFFEQILVHKIGMASLWVGEDFVFGRQKRGCIHLLRHLAARDHLAAHVVRHRHMSGQIVSSTRIRGLIATAQLGLSRRCLGRFWSFRGTVIRGQGLGRTMGFPTANIDPQQEIFVPDGIYAAKVQVGASLFRAAVYIGRKPTFFKKDQPRSIEAFLMDTHRRIYGCRLEVFLVAKIRDDARFNGVSDLTIAIARDVRKSRQILRRFSL